MTAFERARRFQDGAEADKWLKRVFGDWAASLTEPEREAVYKYKQEDYEEINAALRNPVQMNEAIETAVDDLDLALSRMRLPESIVVYRGFDGSHLLPAIETLAGDIIEEHAYVSTTLLRRVAEGFCASADEAVLAQTIVPGGTHVGAFVGAPDLIDERHEYEILLPRSTFLRINDVDHDGVNPVIDMEVLT